ncbi:Rap1a/Tai family immunity protein [Halioxenophilus aromaticivorans]|uniref:Rap1a immunity protein domain-containing protein n=1 Tax=Halioxenophilus aromaticivorans TaxID=1306992 RepID=A0AAV3U4M1_9ALTE
MKTVVILALSCSVTLLQISAPSSANATQISDMGATGPRLLEQCEITKTYIRDREMKDALNTGLCTGLIQGTVLTMKSQSKDDRLPKCFDNLTTESVVKLVVEYLHKNPDKLAQNNAAELIIQSVTSSICVTTLND